ncbi:MAG: L,D-transpeptidase family protein [Rhodospirillales bacterium]
MTLHRALATLLIALAVVSASPASAATVRDRVEAAPELAWGLLVQRSWPAVRRYYAERDHRPVWSRDGRATPAAHAVLAAIRNADNEGLDPGHYRLEHLEAQLSSHPATPDFDVDLTGEVLHFLAEVQFGRLAVPADLAGEDSLSDDRFDPVRIIDTITSAPDPAAAVRHLAPANSHYRALRRARTQYANAMMRGGWPTIPPGPAIKPGASDPRVPLIRQRLAATGDLGAGPAARSDEVYDDATRLAVENLQRRYGLDQDGIVGKMTLAAMNVPAAARVDQISLNMERWRRFREDPDGSQVVVNLAGFDLRVYEDGQIVMQMPVAVGRPYRRTPIFNGLMTYLEFSPTWTVPPTILKEDILPVLREDPTHLATKGIDVYDGWHAGAAKLDPLAVDWKALGNAALSYRFVQPPGPNNALGGVKFMFPNEHSIYLHDTPDRTVFTKASRAFSSGCIRVQQPVELAAYLLREDPDWNETAVRDAMAQSSPTRINLPRPVVVRITYSTAWVGDGGDIHFRDDVYGRDASLREMLQSWAAAH